MHKCSEGAVLHLALPLHYVLRYEFVFIHPISLYAVLLQQFSPESKF